MEVVVYTRYKNLPFYIKKYITVCKDFFILNNVYYYIYNILKINDYLYQFHFKNIILRFIKNYDMQITLKILNPTALQRKVSCLL